MKQLSDKGKKAAGLLAVWTLGAGIAGSAWAVGTVENTLNDAAEQSSAVQDALDAGAVLAWNGDNVEIDVGALSDSEAAAAIEALQGLDGIGTVNQTAGGPDEVAAPTSTAPTSTAIPSTTVPSTTAAPATTTTSVPTTTTTTAPTTTSPTTTAAPTTAAARSTEAPSTDTVPGGATGEATALVVDVVGERSITFYFSTAIPTAESVPVIDDLEALLIEYPKLGLHVIGHADSAGREDANIVLSIARAQSVANHLILRGIAADRMTVEGRGSTEPVANESSTTAADEDRRVSIQARGEL